MSIIHCEDCPRVINTDAAPETFREKYDDAPLCDACFDAREAEKTPLDTRAEL